MKNIKKLRYLCVCFIMIMMLEGCAASEKQNSADQEKVSQSEQEADMNGKNEDVESEKITPTISVTPTPTPQAETGQTTTEESCPLAQKEETKTEEETQSGEAMLQAPSGSTSAELDMDTTSAGTIISEEQVDYQKLESYFVSFEISCQVLTRIDGKSYTENPDVGLQDLRYLKMLHYNFDGEIQMGEMIVNAAIAEDIREIFMGLFQAKYQIQSMYLIDDFWAGDGEKSDTNSIEHNNTSAFCYREQTGGGQLSNHALGRAIDINPQQNPYVTFNNGKASWYHSNSDGFIDRSTGAEHMITEDDLCYQLFVQHGFEWGGNWENPKDYQHFEKTT